MSILATIENCIRLIPVELVNNRMFYIELPKVAYETVRQECEAKYELTSEANIVDLGKGYWMIYMGYKIVFVVNTKAPEAEDFYIAFKTKII